jgi:hypothetical protein
MLEHDTIPELKQRIAYAVAELRSLAQAETITAAAILAIANRLQARREPAAPSLPRRETPGTEVQS